MNRSGLDAFEQGIVEKKEITVGGVLSSSYISGLEHGVDSKGE